MINYFVFTYFVIRLSLIITWHQSLLSVYAYLYGFCRTMPYDIARRRAVCEWTFRPTANLSIASYSRRARNVWTPSDLFRTAYRRDIGMESQRYFRNFATCRHISVALQRWLVRNRLHIWQLDRSNGGVTPTVTSDDLDLLSWHWHAFKRKFRNQDLGAFLSGQFRSARCRRSFSPRERMRGRSWES